MSAIKSVDTKKEGNKNVYDRNRAIDRIDISSQIIIADNWLRKISVRRKHMPVSTALLENSMSSDSQHTTINPKKCSISFCFSPKTEKKKIKYI